jgi:hypothetical protein
LRTLREHIAVRTLWLLLAFQIFNCTIDAPDLTPPGAPEDLTYNEMESITEFVVEIVFGLEDFFKETDDHDNAEEQLLKLKTSIDYFPPPQRQEIIPINSAATLRKSLKIPDYKIGHQFLDEPNAPPPWIV